MVGAVAGVEADGQRPGQVQQFGVQLGDSARRSPGAISTDAPHGGVAVTGLLQPVQDSCRRGRELHDRERGARPVQPGQMTFDEVQAALLIAGGGTEQQVLADLLKVVAVVAHPLVGGPMGLGRLFEPTGADVGHEQFGLDPVRLLAAAGPLGGFTDRDGLLVTTLPGQVLDLMGGHAADAVGVAVATCADQQVVLAPGGFRVSDVVGDRPAVLVDGVQALRRQQVASFHVVEHRVGTVQGDVGEVRESVDHPLEVPAQACLGLGSEQCRIAVIGGQPPSEGDHSLGRFAAVVEHARCRRAHLVGELRQFLCVGVPQDLFDSGELRRPGRQAARLLEHPPQFLLAVAHSVPPVAPVATARPIRPRNDWLRAAVSAGRSGWCPSRSAWT